MVKGFSLTLHHLKFPNPAGIDTRASRESGMLLRRAGVVPACSRFICGVNELLGPASDGASLTAQIQQLLVAVNSRTFVFSATFRNY